MVTIETLLLIVCLRKYPYTQQGRSFEILRGKGEIHFQAGICRGLVWGPYQKFIFWGGVWRFSETTQYRPKYDFQALFNNSFILTISSEDVFQLLSGEQHCIKKEVV